MASLLAAWGIQAVLDLTVLFAALFSFLTAEEPNRRPTEQRAINLLAQFVERGLAQPEEFAVQKSKGVKEREGDDFYPQQRHHGHRMVMGAMGQVPVLGQFAKGVVLDLPTQVSQVPDGGGAIRLQISRHHPNPLLLFFLAPPLFARPLSFPPPLPHPDDPNRPGIGVGEA